MSVNGSNHKFLEMLLKAARGEVLKASIINPHAIPRRSHHRAKSGAPCLAGHLLLEFLFLATGPNR